MMTPEGQHPGPAPLSEMAKGLISLAIILHLACVLTVLAANFRRSAVLSRLVGLYAPYTQALNLDPDQTPYHFTHGRTVDDDAVLTVELYADADTPVAQQQPMGSITLPDRGSRWMEARRRHLALAKVVQIHSPTEEEPDEYSAQVAIEVAKAVGRRLMDEHKARRAVVRCVRRMSQPHDLSALNPGFPPNDPQAPAYEVTLFTADVWIDEDGRTEAARREARGQLAPLRTGTAP